MDAREALFAKVAPALNAQPADLECVNGTVRVKSDPSRSLELEAGLLEDRRHAAYSRAARIPTKTKPPDLTNSGVGGVGMADVEVDIETGIVKS